jgi:xanthine dehydrogenase small subunit
MRSAIRFVRRGEVVERGGFHPRTTLLDYLRLSERATGTKEGCAEGDCGACTVALGRVRGGRLRYEPVNACILLLGQADGAEVVTVEDLAEDGDLHPVQRAMVEHHGSQCGFCTPGIVMSLFCLHQEAEERPPSRAAINDALAGNLCRCTGYRPILDAAVSALAEEPVDSFACRRIETAAALLELDPPTRRGDLLVGDESRFFAAPGSIESLADLVREHPDATLVAGATDVGLWITKALQPLEKLIWLGRVEDFGEVLDLGSELLIGAGASLEDATPALAALDPDLGELMRRFGSRQVRASGTVGGNIANGSPIGDLAPALIALGSRLQLQRGGLDRGGETRLLPLEAFFLAYRRQDRRPGEFITAVWVPKLRPDEAFRCLKVSKRFDEDILAVMVAVKLTLEGRRIARARIAFGGMAGVPKRADGAEAALRGVNLGEETEWGPALDALSADFTPMSDHRASAAYRAAVARNLLLKALHEIATGRTEETRLVGHRPIAQAAE